MVNFQKIDKLKFLSIIYKIELIDKNRSLSIVLTVLYGSNARGIKIIFKD